MSFKVCIAGGGSTYTPGIVKAMLINKQKFPLTTLVLYDNDRIRNQRMGVIIHDLLNQLNHEDIQLVVTCDPEEAFTDAEFIFSQLRVGGLKMRMHDETIPQKYGLVGQETCGLGGFSYGLRSIKGFIEFMHLVMKYAPNAWVLNYTNPESLISEAVRREFPEAKIINACDMTISIEEAIAQNFGYNRNNWRSTYYGLNHFGWYESIYDETLKKDVMPELIEKIKVQGLKPADFDISDQSWVDTYARMQEMLEMFPNNIPNTYMQYYLMPEQIVAANSNSKSRAETIMNGREKDIENLYQQIQSNTQPKITDVLSGVHGEYIVKIAIAILNDERSRFMVIVPNEGSIPNLRSDAVVEVPAYISATGIEIIALRHDIPDFHKGLMEAQVAAEKLLVDAYFENSYDKALQAFTLNQTVSSSVVAKKILDEFIKVNGEYWPLLNTKE